MPDGNTVLFTLFRIIEMTSLTTTTDGGWEVGGITAISTVVFGGKVEPGIVTLVPTVSTTVVVVLEAGTVAVTVVVLKCRA